MAFSCQELVVLRVVLRPPNSYMYFKQSQSLHNAMERSWGSHDLQVR